MRFDWYQPTIPDSPIVIVEELLARLAPGGEVQEGRGKNNYWQSFTIRDRDRERVAVVLAGGPNGDPNVMASGTACDAFVPVVRELWPEHRVTRADVAEDFQGEGSFETLEAVCRSTLSKHPRVKGWAYVPDDPAEGRSYNMGSVTSDVRMRLYDKSAERRAKLPPERHCEVPENVTRLEVVVKPRKDWREHAAKMPVEVFWGFAGWTAEVAARAMQLEVQRIAMQGGRESDHDRAMRYLIAQYGPTLVRMFEDHGDWKAVGMQLGLLIDERRRRTVA